MIEAQPGFPSTRWSLVLQAASSEQITGNQALAELCELYWQPLYCFLRGRGHGPEEAIDLVHGLIVRLLEGGNLRGATRERGNFRSFLLGALKHYVANEKRRAAAAKRGGSQMVLSLDAEAAEAVYCREAADYRTPETLYMRRWAHSVLDDSLARLGELYRASGKSILFHRLRPLLAGDKLDADYEQVAGDLGMSEGALKVAVHRMRRQYRELLRQAVAETVSDPGEIQQELQCLIEALA